MPISVSYEVNLTILGLYSLENSLDGPFFLSMSRGMWVEKDLKHFRKIRKIYCRWKCQINRNRSFDFITGLLLYGNSTWKTKRKANEQQTDFRSL